MSRTHYIIALQMPSILGGERRKGAIRYIRRYESYDFSEYPSGTKGARTHPRRPCESTERCKADRCQMGIGGISSRSRNAYALAKLLGVSVDDLIAHNEAATGYPIPPRGKHIFGIVRMENADRSSSRRKRAISSSCTQDPNCSFWATKHKASHCRRSKMRNPCLRAMGE